MSAVRAVVRVVVGVAVVLLWAATGPQAGGDAVTAPDTGKGRGLSVAPAVVASVVPAAPAAVAPAAPAAVAPAAVAPAAPAAAALADDVTAVWWILGGGATPTSTQISLHADAALARAHLDGPGLVHFAAGAGADVVAVRTDAAGDDDAPLAGRGVDAVRAALAALLAPGHEAGLRYAKVTLPALPAHAAAVDALLAAQLGRGAAPLFVVVSAHGERADTPAQVRLPLWGGQAWTPQSLAQALDAAPSPRPLRLVVAACFSGGFAELAFHGADASLGAAAHDRCGLFAATWDLESSGCDPDPDRSRHEGFARHFWAALRGRDRDGTALARPDIDFDGDGAIGLLDAHTRVRIAATSQDVPTTTSERWLRHLHGEQPLPSVDDAEVAPGHAKAAPDDDAAPSAAAAAALPEELAVIAALSRQLAVATTRAAAREGYRQRDGLAIEVEEAVQDASAAVQSARSEIIAALLARFAVLEDPWHPAFEPTLQREHAAIAALLDAHPARARYRQGLVALAAADRLLGRALTARALGERLLRAHETLQAATIVLRGGGAGVDTFLKLRQCERFVPPLRAD